MGSIHVGDVVRISEDINTSMMCVLTSMLEYAGHIGTVIHIDKSNNSALVKNNGEIDDYSFWWPEEALYICEEDSGAEYEIGDPFDILEE